MAERPFDLPGGQGSFAYAQRRLRRGWRSGELLILALAIAIAVATMSAVSLFFGSLRVAIERQTGEALGADVIFSSRDPLPPAILDALAASGARTLQGTTFASVVLHDELTALASLKAVAPGFPLRGTLRIADEPFGPARSADGRIPARGEAWVDVRLWQQLGLSPGAVIEAGALTLRVGAVIAEEPGRGFGFTDSDLVPRLMLNAEDVAASQLLGPGARAQYQAMAAGEPRQLEPLIALPLPRGMNRLIPSEARPQLVQAVDNSSVFLAVARLAATLLAAAAIALCAGQWGQKLAQEVALLKCLGAPRTFILDALAWMVLMLGAAATLAGAVLGLAAQQALGALFESVMLIDLPAPPVGWPLARAAGLVLILLFGFALPAVLRAAATTPMRVFQRDAGVPNRRLPAIMAVLALGGLTWLQIRDPLFAAVLLGGIAAAAAVLALLALGLVRLLTPLRRAVGSAWRFGLGNVARRRGTTVAQVVALGLALQALLLVTVVRADLLSSWQARLPADTPNHFFVNLQDAQLEPMRDFFVQRGLAAPQPWPMTRGRLVALRGERVEDIKDPDPALEYWLTRDYNMSWTDSIGTDNEITAGTWWGPAGAGKAWLSADDSAVKGLKLELGDTVTLDFAGNEVEFTVNNLRKVKWDSFRPNFFLLAPTGVLEDKAPAQWLTSAYVPPDRRALLRDFIRAFPNVTVLDLDALMNQVRTIMERIVRAVGFVLLFTLAAGITVLLAAIEGTRDERVRETGVLRALGASRSTVLQGLLAEYAVLGLLAGTVAAVSAQAVAWILAEQVLNIPYGPRPMFWLLGAGAGAVVVTFLGWLSLRSTLATAPHTVLKATA